MIDVVNEIVVEKARSDNEVTGESERIANLVVAGERSGGTLAAVKAIVTRHHPTAAAAAAAQRHLPVRKVETPKSKSQKMQKRQKRSLLLDRKSWT
jgi:hypothetical protein